MAMHALVGAVPVPRAAQGSSTAARAGPLRAMRSVASRGVALRQGPARNTAAVRTHGRRPLAVRAAAVGAEEVELDSDEQRIQRAIQIRGNSGKMFKKVLCANRGEIAVRVFRASAELGARTVAIFSPPDRLQPHRYKADESYCVGEGMDITPVGCYLAVEEIVKIAKAHGVEAIHPGYGFLSERSDFAQLCQKEGIAFVGPDFRTLDQMGDKTAARAIAIECEVPVIPGTDGAVSTLEEAEAFVEQFGCPVIMKAAMGGGGRGMRVVREKADLAGMFERASSEAEAAFGDGRVFIERFITKPRHIEVQILADSYGNVVHLHERDCSVQRRHQKVVEMAPALELPEATRQACFADAIKLCKHINYKNAGTVEFLVDMETGEHYFIEVNPRVQVEHTVTEEVTGIDIVQSQIRIAAGASLSDLGITCQEDVTCRGVAIQCRITTEDPAMNFQPNVGRLEVYRCPGGMGVRIDTAMSVGTNISPHYDSLLTKLTVRGSDFNSAVTKLYRCLTEFRVRGVKTNIPFLQNVLCCPSFLNSTIDTNYVDTSPDLFKLPAQRDRATRMLTYLAEMVVNGPKHPGAVGLPPIDVKPIVPPTPSTKKEFPGWRPLLIEKGPKEFAKAVRAHQGLLLTDTTWRDAHQSLLATRMRTIDMDNVANYTSYALNEAFSIEMWGGATFDVSMRFLHECPWARLEKLRKKVPNVPFQMLLRGTNAVGYTTYPDNTVKEFVKEAKNRGIDIFRVFDSLNYVENLKFGIEAVHEAGGVVEATICYTGDVSDPTKTKYDLDYYINLTEQLVECDIHLLAIKDMAGLLKPKAATMLVSALRERFPDLPIHVHTHDTAGVGVATMLACAEAGADIVDGAIDAMSGLTSQPSLGALVVSTQGTELDTGLKLGELLPLNTYWEMTRGLYRPFECSLRSGTSDVYTHEMPGGQYTNLKFQSQSLGLEEQWEEVKLSYAMANRVLGDIVKVTPSSKVVGDLAQFMVANKLDEAKLAAQASTLSFPTSVVEFFQGYIGQPYGGFPAIQKDVVKDKPVVQGRPGIDLAPLDFKSMRMDLMEKFNSGASMTDVLSSAMYPKVYDEYRIFRQKYSDLSVLPTVHFLRPMKTDEELEVQIEQGKSLFVTYKAIGELKPDGMREVFFELNGIPRTVEVFDELELEKSKAAGGGRTVNERADPLVLGSVGAPMAGKVIEVKLEPGVRVEAGQPLAIMSAMKMETTVSAPVAGIVAQVAVAVGDEMKAGDLLVLIDEKAEGEGALPAVLQKEA